MLPDRVSNPGPLTYESGALPTALRGPALTHCVQVDSSIVICFTSQSVTRDVGSILSLFFYFYAPRRESI